MPAGGGGGWVCPHITHTQPMWWHAGTRLCKLYRMMVVAPRSGAAAAAAWGRRAAARGSSSSGGGGAGGRSCLCVVDGTRVAPSFALCRTLLCMTLYIQATKGGLLAGDAVQTGWVAAGCLQQQAAALPPYSHTAWCSAGSPVGCQHLQTTQQQQCMCQVLLPACTLFRMLA